MFEAVLISVAACVILSVSAEVWIHFRSKKVHWVARFESSQDEVAYVRGYGKRRIGWAKHQKVVNPDTDRVTRIEYATHSISAIRRNGWEFVRFEKYVDQPYLTAPIDTHHEDDAALHAIHESIRADQPIVTRDLRPPGGG